MEAEKVTYFVGVPLMSYEIASHPNREKYDLSACKSFAAGGAPRPVEHVTKIKEAFPGGFPLLGLWPDRNQRGGLRQFQRELHRQTRFNRHGERSRWSIWRSLMMMATQLAAGQVGEVCIRSVANFRGYWNNEEATQKAFTKDHVFPHRRPRLSRRGRVPLHRRPQEGHHHPRRREHLLHRGGRCDLRA
jgi:long-chain acyl-CoA synthetase